MDVLTADSTREVEPQLRFPPSRWLLVVGLLALLFVAALGWKLQDVRGPVHVDVATASRIVERAPHGRHPGSEWWRSLVDLGSEGPVLVAVLAMAAWALHRRDTAGFLVVLAGPLGALFTAEVILKPLVERTALNGALSYPSGHVTAVAACATCALLLVYRYSGWQSALLWSPVALAVSGLLAIGVVVLGWHYATDSVAGVALGFGVLCVCAGAADAVRQARWPV